TAQTLTISGIVRGVEVSAERVVLEEGARVDGDLVYTSTTRAQVSEGAVVTGRLVQRRPPENAAGSPALGVLNSVIGALVLGLAVLWLLPPLLPAAAQALRKSPAAVAGGALAGLVLIPVAAVGLLAGALFTGVGLSLAALIVAGYGLLLILANIVTGFALGTVILRKADIDPRTDFRGALFCLLAGVVIIGMLGAVPFLGGVILVLTAFAGFGAGLVAFLRWRRRARSVSISGSSISY
ncbi:MAG: polymer-forming cytoskeletal protein, partial [Actinomycetota bacterium]